MVDKSRRRHLRHIATGLCRYCRNFPIAGQDICFRHWVLYKIRKARMKPGHLSDRERVVREHFIIALGARYLAIKNGMLQPMTELERAREATYLRLRIGMGWGGIAGVKKVATLIKSVDRRAVKDRKEDVVP